MKQYIAIVFFALFGLTLNAQTIESTEADNSSTKIEERIDKIKDELSLSTEQESKLREAMKIQMEELKKEKRKIRDAEKVMKEINKTYHESLVTFLSEDQMTLLKGMKPSQEEREARAKTKGGKKGQK